MTPKYFPTPLDLRRWFATHHASASELWVGFYKRGTGTPSVTWPESVDEALAVGWIDGIRKSIDVERYMIRFTPRRPGSVWSAVNIRRVAELEKEGRLRPAGRAAFAKRRENRSGVYSYEQRPQELPEPYADALRKNTPAWTFFQAQIPSYRKAVTWWVLSAKQEDTRRKRLAMLIEWCASGRMHPQLLPRAAEPRSRPARSPARQRTRAATRT